MARLRPSQMRVVKTSLDGVLQVETDPDFFDHRGTYRRLWHREDYARLGIKTEFVETDVSISKHRVLRGLHGDYHTWKLVSCAFGEFFLVVVNNLPQHPQYLKWEGFRLGSNKYRQVLVPPGFGNAHVVLTSWAVYHYAQSAGYQGSEGQFTLNWRDPAIGIVWPISNPILSDRDRNAPLINSVLRMYDQSNRE